MPLEPVPMGGYALTENAPLATRNTLHVQARAHLLAELHDASKLPELLAFPAVRAQPLLVLGEGSNLLLTRDFPGTVLAMLTHGVQVEEEGDVTRIAVAAGERWDDFVRWSLGQGFAGLENLIAIPGTVGAAPVQNIGAYGTEVAEFVESVEAWDVHEHRIAVIGNAECAFGYRQSRFKREPGRYIVTAVRFALPRHRPLRLDYAGMHEELARLGVDTPAPYHVAEAVVRMRGRKLPDPAVIGNAGSFFKNPIVDAERAAALKATHPELPAWPQPNGQVKLSAAWMIDRCGLKGSRQGDVGISNRHALVVVNHGYATGPELWAFAQHVMATVEAAFGVRLEPEPVIV